MNYCVLISFAILNFVAVNACKWNYFVENFMDKNQIKLNQKLIKWLWILWKNQRIKKPLQYMNR